MSDVRVVLLKPGDLLIIGNTGPLDDDAIEHMLPQLSALKDSLKLGGIVHYEGDVDLAAVARAVLLDPAVRT